MEQHEANTALRRMMATWPNQTLPDETVEIWFDKLCKLDVSFASDVITTLQGHLKFFPSVAEWNQVALARSQRSNVAALSAPQPTRRQREVGRAWMAELRDAMGQIGKGANGEKKHPGVRHDKDDDDHKNCPECNAISDRVQVRLKGNQGAA